jgi:hypothetical protein
MTTIETTTTTVQRPESEHLADEAQFAAAAFLARYSGRTLDAYRQDLRRPPESAPGSKIEEAHTSCEAGPEASRPRRRRRTRRCLRGRRQGQEAGDRVRHTSRHGAQHPQAGGCPTAAGHPTRRAAGGRPPLRGRRVDGPARRRVRRVAQHGQPRPTQGRHAQSAPQPTKGRGCLVAGGCIEDNDEGFEPDILDEPSVRNGRMGPPCPSGQGETSDRSVSGRRRRLVQATARPIR